MNDTGKVLGILIWVSYEKGKYFLIQRSKRHYMVGVGLRIISDPFGVLYESFGLARPFGPGRPDPEGPDLMVNEWDTEI